MRPDGNWDGVRMASDPLMKVVTEKGAAFDITGPGLATVMLTTPGEATKLNGTVAIKWFASLNAVDNIVPFQRTTAWT